MPSVIRTLHRSSQKRRHRSIRRITQKTGTSCGIACVAMLARVSYRDAFRIGVALWDAEYWETGHRTSIDELRKMLWALGWRLGRKVRCKTWRKVPPFALVAVQRKSKKDTWHWVVADADDEGVFAYDPRASVKQPQRRDFQKLPVSWYHHVRPSR